MSNKTMNSFVMYRSYYKIYKKLQKQAEPGLAERFLDAICNYAFDGVLPDEDDPVMLYAEGPIEQIRVNLKKYEQAIARNEKDY